MFVNRRFRPHLGEKEELYGGPRASRGRFAGGKFAVIAPFDSKFLTNPNK